MEDFAKEYLYGVILVKVNLTRATLREAQELKQILEEEITIQHKKLVLDLSQCEFIDSTFFGVLIFEHKKMIASGGILNIVRPINTNGNFLHLTQVLDHLNMYETRSEAVEYFDKNIPIQNKNLNKDE